jgi:hypothetical protein
MTQKVARQGPGKPAGLPYAKRHPGLVVLRVAPAPVLHHNHARRPVLLPWRPGEDDSFEAVLLMGPVGGFNTSGVR